MPPAALATARRVGRDPVVAVVSLAFLSQGRPLPLRYPRLSVSDYRHAPSGRFLRPRPHAFCSTPAPALRYGYLQDQLFSASVTALPTEPARHAGKAIPPSCRKLPVAALSMPAYPVKSLLREGCASRNFSNVTGRTWS